MLHSINLFCLIIIQGKRLERKNPTYLTLRMLSAGVISVTLNKLSSKKLYYMKKISFILLFQMALVIHAQTSCCKISGSTEAFAMLGKSKNFVMVHENPLPFILEHEKGKDINLKTNDGKDAHIYEIKAEKPSQLTVFVIHEWWGLNDYIKQEAEKIYNTLGDVNVIAIDLYDGRIANNKDSASKLMQAVNGQRAESILKTVISYVGKDAKIASIGWCFGGGWSMQASLIAGKQSLACVIYYGMPEQNLEKIKTLNAPVYFIWPEQDQWINKEVVTKFETNMKSAKKTLTVKAYTTNHAFANPSNPIYNKELAEDAFKNAMAFIKTNLK